MYKHRELTESRIRRRIEAAEQQIFHQAIPLSIEAAAVGGEPIPYAEAIGRDFAAFDIREPWGAPWGTTWFRFRAVVPDQWAGKHVVALVDFGGGTGEGFGPEGLVWQDGKPTRAINVNRHDVEIVRCAKGGEEAEFLVEAASNPAAKLDGRAEMLMPGGGAAMCRIEKAVLACFDPDAAALVYDARAAYETMMVLPVESPRRGTLLSALNQMATALEPSVTASAIAAARAALRDVLHARNGDTVHRISAIGHAHIDTAWLWPLRETIRKCARTFATALDYMKDYPEYVFGCSQAQQYLWMKEYYPDIFDGIKRAVERGQWEPIGSMWIEADCNLPSGESLVRQILYGKKFFREELGVETKEVWIPDVFGYSASMPQIMKNAGIDYFLTQKISWNQFNKFPHHTFEWEGIDGTRIFTHFPPADTYNGNFAPSELDYNVRNFKEHDRAGRSLYVYGYGDGGGGPTKGMLEFAGRFKDLEGLPKVTLEKVADFFPKAAADARDLPLWVGELYLELHRGTYTSQAATKRGNRKSEALLQEAELFDAIAGTLCGPLAYDPAPVERAVYDVVGKNAPGRTAAGDLERAWKLVLLNQFHDIIPGSSIHWVYEDSRRDYETIASLADSVRRASQVSLAAKIDVHALKSPVVVFNSLAHDRTEVVRMPGGALRRVDVPSCGYAAVDADADSAPPQYPAVARQEAGGVVLENGLLRVTIDGQGLIPSLVDIRAARQVVAPGACANLFQLHIDRPAFWSAWDIDLYYREQVEYLSHVDSIEIVETGPLRAAVEVRRSFGASSIRQRIVLDCGSPRLDFDTSVEWREDEKLLKVAFPVDVRSPRATYEIQYGHTERPTHTNTSWDMARFEVCAQKWADLSEPGYGVALLNDCKYGHDILGNVMRLTLLRAPTAPDPAADRGLHRFVYSLMPHSGDLRDAGVIEQAYALNSPLRAAALQAAADATGPCDSPLSQSFLRLDGPGAVVESVKTAEGGGDIIVRLYESWGGRRKVRLSTALPATGAALTDLLETDLSEIPMDGQSILLDLHPFEIVTVRLRTGRPSTQISS